VTQTQSTTARTIAPPPRAAGIEEDGPIAPEVAAGCRVVVCDDVEDFRTLVVALITRVPGFRVVGQAKDGREAVEVVTSEQPDVVLLDLSMPEMDGMEALPLIRSAAPDTRVLVLTGFASRDLRELALASGAFGFIEKGTPPSGLVDAVRSACAG
jgi:DNA-binding NarL/FixJ family response regulator